MKGNLSKLLLLLIVFLRKRASSLCLFPPGFEGEYIIQNAAVKSDVLQYSTVNITADWIYPYGQCYSRNKSNVIVSISSEENSCFRCFNLKMVSKNIILLIHNREVDINSKCSSSADTVKCPSDVSLEEEQKSESDFRSIILYRTAEREGPRRNEFCPFEFFDGEIKFDYYLNDEKVCSGYESTLSQCPSGSSLNVRYKGCNYPQQSANFECIGHWHALNNYYLAVIDWINGTTPSYRCGTYHYDNNDKTKITLKINTDCSSLSSKSGFSSTGRNQQTFEIVKTPLQRSEMTTSKFPEWLQGQWQFLKVEKTQLIFRDQYSLKSYRMSLITQLSDEKFMVSSRSQCGEESFKCLWIRQLHKNVLEFQVSSESSQLSSSDTCSDDKYFHHEQWVTQSRIGKSLLKTPCPINGKYFGRFPDNPMLCALMESSCNSDVMHFQVGPCDSSEIYEKRIYKCLGEWSDERNSTVYTYTKRIDDVVNTYECFVGLMAGSEKQIIIREAGANCFKTIDVQHYGMEMNQTEKCRVHETNDGEAEVAPTQDGHSITYETVFDDENNNLDINTLTSTRKTKTTERFKNHDDDENSIENDISYESKSIKTSAAAEVINSSGILLITFSSLCQRYFMS